MSQWHGGKGSRRRTPQDKKTFDDNWDRIFKKHDKCGTSDCCGKCETAVEHLHDKEGKIIPNLVK